MICEKLIDYPSINAFLIRQPDKKGENDLAFLQPDLAFFSKTKNGLKRTYADRGFYRSFCLLKFHYPVSLHRLQCPGQIADVSTRGACQLLQRFRLSFLYRPQEFSVPTTENLGHRFNGIKPHFRHLAAPPQFAPGNGDRVFLKISL